MKKINILLFFFILFFLPLLAFSAEVKNIDAAEAKQNIEKGKYELILDVRTPPEYAGEMGHIKDSQLIPIQELDKRMGEISSFKEKNILVYCAVGGRSARAAESLAKNGFSHVENMLGGMTEWNKQGYSVERK